MSSLSIYYQNIRGLRTKTSQLLRNTGMNSYDILSLTETWLIDGIANSEFITEDY